MKQLAIVLFIGLIAGFSLSFLPIDHDENESARSAIGPAVASVECVCDLQRNETISPRLQKELKANKDLRAEIDRLNAMVDELSAQESGMSSTNDGDWLQAAWTDLASDDEPADRHQQLIDAGFTSARADWIINREAELQMAAIEERRRDPSAAEYMDYLGSRTAGRQALRDEIGDFEYEQYLDATGQSTRIAITQVIAASPAAAAGFEVGDEIIDYDGSRVFNIIELSDIAQRGNSNDFVVVNIERDGAPMQLMLQRGPLGVSGGRPARE